MNNQHVTIFLSAAEASADAHAAGLIRAIRKRLPDARFIGAAGEKMAAEGCEVVLDLTSRASMLLGGPILKLGYYCRALRRLKKTIRDLHPDVHIPVDSPALNWHLARTARRVGAAVVYYVAPQVWAWAPWRVRKLARLTDHVACILPFEQGYLRQRGVMATYVGHPLFDELDEPSEPMPDLLEAFAHGTWRVALLPGSRSGEIKAHAPALAKVAQAIQKKYPKAHCTLTARTQGCAEIVRAVCGESCEIVVGQTSEVLKNSHFAIVVSGTVTLEAANFGVPMVVFYRASRICQALVGRWLIRTPYLSLVNILAGQMIVPELMPWNGKLAELQETVMEMMEDLGCLLEMRRKLLDVVSSFRPADSKTAGDNAAEIVLQVLRERNR